MTCLLWFYLGFADETPGKKVNFDEFAAPNKTFENVLRPVSTDNITPKVQIEKLSQDALGKTLFAWKSQF